MKLLILSILGLLFNGIVTIPAYHLAGGTLFIAWMGVCVWAADFEGSQIERKEEALEERRLNGKKK